MKRALAITTMAVGVAIGATAVGVASAVTPDSTGTIHTCYDNTTGGLRVSDPGNGPPACANTETPLSWQSGDLPHDVGETTTTVSLPAKTWVDLATLNLTLNSTSDVWLDATANAQGARKGTTQLQLRVLEDGVPETDTTLATLVANAFSSVPTGLLKCNGMPAGQHTWTLQARANVAGATIVHSTLGGLALPGSS